jgi:hypothetical protein
VDGKNSEPAAWLGPDNLDAAGRPRAGSVVIGAADPLYAPPVDFTGRRRDAQPDIGAYEYRG